MTVVITHDGKFHADDVFAVAALLMLERGAEVVRTRNIQTILKGDFVVDVGGVSDERANRFDHHQVGGAGKRPLEQGKSGVPYAAFGLVWKKFGEKLCGNAPTASRVEETLVIPIDANDNGIDLSVPAFPHSASYEISDVIRAFNPTWQEGDALINKRFTEAAFFAERLIEREIKRAEALIAGQEKVETAYREARDKRLVVLDGDYSWKDTLAQFSEPLYVVHPQNGTWRLYAVRDNPHRFENREDLPEDWAGLRDKELAKTTGVADAVFAHRNRFMAVARSKEGAIALAVKALAGETLTSKF